MICTLAGWSFGPFRNLDFLDSGPSLGDSGAINHWPGDGHPRATNGHWSLSGLRHGAPRRSPLGATGPNNIRNYKCELPQKPEKRGLV